MMPPSTKSFARGHLRKTRRPESADVFRYDARWKRDDRVGMLRYTLAGEKGVRRAFVHRHVPSAVPPAKLVERDWCAFAGGDGLNQVHASIGRRALKHLDDASTLRRRQTGERRRRVDHRGERRLGCPRIERES